MTPVPLDLPLRPSEAALLGNLILDDAERKPLTDELRNRLANRAAVLQLETIRPYFGSLERDPVHPSAYYLAVDGASGEPLLLHLALATAPTSSIFYKPLLIGRTRRANGPEMVINAVPFDASDEENLEKFATRINAAFRPRPQGSRTAIAVGPVNPAAVLPSAFDAFRTVQKRTGRNFAATFAPAEAPVREVYCAGLWAAIRAGWRDGYSAGIEIPVAPANLETAKALIRKSAFFSAFSIDVCRLIQPDGGAVEQQFDAAFSAEERGRVFDEFGDLGEFSPEDVVGLSVRFGKALAAIEQLHECIRQARTSLKGGKSFDLELSLEHSDHVTTTKELGFCLHWLRAHGHAPQVFAPHLERGAELVQQLEQLGPIARQYQCTLSVRGASEFGPEILNCIGRATGGRLLYRLTGELAERERYINFLSEHLVG